MDTPAKPAYERLSGFGYRRMLPGWAIFLLFFVIGIFVLLLRGRRVQLWLGEDHLLLVEWDGYKEYYKRFRYADIQSLTIRKTDERFALNALLAFLLVVLILLAWLVQDPVGTGIFLGLCLIVTLVLVINSLMGPSCQCFLRTAVQTEELVCLPRVRKAQAAFQRLRPLLAAAQEPFPTAPEPAEPAPPAPVESPTPPTADSAPSAAPTS